MIAEVLHPDRVLRDIAMLAALTGDARGAQRVAWGQTWQSARDWLTGELAALGVHAERDEAGNLWAELPATVPDAPVLVLGSHLDSVPDGGRLDGCLGVLAALEVLRVAHEHGIRPATLRLVDWADEEGARFGVSLLGSSAAAGHLDVHHAATLQDAYGMTMADALATHGVTMAEMPKAAARLADVDAMLELHIEQGPLLEAANVPLGIPTGSLAIERVLVRFDGTASHAGTTPMALRADPGVAAARLALVARQAAVDAGALATTGRIVLEPNIATAVAAVAEISLDVRHADTGTATDLTARLLGAAKTIAKEERCTIRATPLVSVPAVAFDAQLRAALARAAPGAPSLPSGALHDAVSVARAGVPAAMLFVRSVGGISHSRLEETSDDDLRAAVTAFGVAVDEVVATLPRVTAA